LVIGYGHSLDGKGTFFNKTPSWVKENKNTTELLKHEQGHSVLAEIHAREKEKETEKLVGKISDSEDNVDKDIHKICDKVQKN
jgi:predicted secreted Zn-dependent protease